MSCTAPAPGDESP